MHISLTLPRTAPASNTANRVVTSRSESELGTATSQLPLQTSFAIQSQQLLKGQKKVRILHQDQIYVLQATRQGKLILTK